jgi:hypothetical protein
MTAFIPSQPHHRRAAFGTPSQAVPSTPASPTVALPPGYMVVPAGSMPAAPAEEEGYDDYISYFNKSADGLRLLLVGRSAREQAPILKARIQNLQSDRKKYAKIPVIGRPITNVLDKEIRRLKAQHAAISVKAKEEEAEAQAELFTKYGIAAVSVLGAVAVVSVIALNVARTRAIEGG